MSATYSALLILLITAVASARWLRARTLVGPRKQSGVLLLQAVSALLLFLGLHPPPTTQPSGALWVLTAGATAVPLPTASTDQRVALPEAQADPSIERAADLATALRAHPGASAIHVLGAGLPLRDQDAARGLRVEFVPTAAASGVIELHAPASAVSGARWTVTGRVNVGAGATVELRDPAGTVVARDAVGASGTFTVQTEARTPGRALFVLRVLDAAQSVVDVLELPLWTRAGAQLKVLLWSGAPSAETKYLRRWAADAGIALTTQIGLSPGVQLRSTSIRIDATSLEAFDLLILDERAWSELSPAARSVLMQAVRGGLGLLLRITAPLSVAQTQALAAVGFAVDAAPITRSAQLGRRTSAESAFDRAASTEATHGAPMVSRRPIRVHSVDAAVLVNDAAGDALSVWRAMGQGRFALSWFNDSFALALDGHGDDYGDLWSKTVTTLARARGEREWTGPSAWVRVGERQSLCGLPPDASVLDPDGQRVSLVRDPIADGCAAWWPSLPGWHLLSSGDQERPSYVHAADAAPALAAAELADATRFLAGLGGSSRQPQPLPTPGNPAPWLAAWLCSSALLWWLERRWLRR